MARKAKGRSRRHHVPTASVAKRQWGFPASQSEYPKQSQDTHLTMQQEARNTERHTISRSNVQLRHHQVTFVSAGNMLRDDLDDSALETVNEGLKELTTSKPEPAQEGVAQSQTLPGHFSSDANMSDGRSQQGQQYQTSGNEAQNIQDDLFFVDFTGDKPDEDSNQVKPQIRPHSPTPTDSSEDEVVFVGRNKSKARQIQADKRTYRETPPTQHPTVTQHKTGGIQSAQGTGSHLSENSENNEAEILLGTTPHARPSDEDLALEDDSEINVNLGGMTRRRRRRGRRVQQQRREMNDEDLILADYIANMQDNGSSEDGSGEASVPAQPLPETGRVESKDSTAVPQEQMVEEHMQRSFSWSSNDLEDLGDLSTSDEIPSEVGRIFSKRQRGVGVQYLVTGKNQVPDEARWILKELLIMTGASEQIKTFEKKEGLLSDFPISSEDSDNISTGHESDDRLGEADVEYGGFPLGRKHQELSDERIAHLLERQEKFGLAADDWNWEEDSGDSDAAKGANPIFRPKPFSKKKRGNRRTQFPSAGAFADALDEDPYHGFDVMDFDRPSLRKKSKGGRQPPEFVLSDSEIEWDLQQAWENDRTKKKAKKRAREELRAKGLLGKQSKMSTGVRFSDSMDTDDIKDKIRAFLLSSSESLSLPPMDKKARKLVHDLANAVSLKSQSRGGGVTRFPMLYKTARTPSFDKKSIGEVDRIFSANRFMRRVGGMKGFEGSTGKSVKTRRSGASAAASYMDGDVVGASAPEIGVENRGRAMLEKMGWSTGTALGASDNKGILQPLAQVVKNTKAGLG